VKRPPLEPEIKRLLARYPGCRWCRKPCVAGQRDATGQPAHLLCQAAFALVSPRPGRVARGRAAINPKLPQAHQISPGTRPGATERGTHGTRR
jgi:hypothetical protein